MNEWMAQLGLLARGDDFSGWANILFIIIIMVFSAIAGLIKNAEAKKRQHQAGMGGSQGPPKGPPRETWQQRLVRKAEEVQRAVEAKYEEAQQPRQMARGRSPDQGKLSVRPGRGGESIMVFEKDRPESTAPRDAGGRRTREAIAATRRSQAKRHLAARRQRQPSVERATLGPQEPGRIGVVPEIPREPVGAHAASYVINYDDPDALKKAILHYEILGKPLALRDPFERTSGY